MHKNAVAGGDANRTAISRADLEQFFLQRMSDDRFDGAEANCVIFQAEAKHFTESFAAQLINAAVRSFTCQGIVDELANTHHAHAAIIFHEDMIVAVDAHDYDAVVAQLIDVEIIAPDAAAECRDQRADFRGRQHFVEARLFDVEDFTLERQDRLRASIASLLRGAAGGIALYYKHFPQRGILFLTLCVLARHSRAIERALAAGHLSRLARGFARIGR